MQEKVREVGNDQCRVQVYLSWRKKVQLGWENSIIYIGRSEVGKRIIKWDGAQSTKGIRFTGKWKQLRRYMGSRKELLERCVRVELVVMNRVDRLQG